MKLSEYIRIILTIVLLYIVWNHAHWSVSLTLSLVALQCEIVGLSIKHILKKMKAESVFKNMFH